MTRSSTRILAGFMVFVAVIAAVQLSLFRDAQPAPDSVEYFEVADQMQRVGYARALSLHWSPLYPLYLLSARSISASPIEQELRVTAVADAVLLVALCAIVGAAFLSLGRLCCPDRDDSRNAWLAGACGLAAYFAFAVLRVGLRMPDALVTCMTVLIVWAWAHAIARGLDPRWSALAGLLSGVAFLARGNLLHWSLVVAAAACVLAPAARFGRRWASSAIFVVGMLAIVGPHVYLLSSARGYFTFGESGKLVFAETYGAVWPNGHPAWPVRTSGGDVRVFTETRDLNFPGFYDPGREYDDATVPFHLSKMVLTVIRSVQASLFGYWSPAFGLLWPLCWALWPIWMFGLAGPPVVGGHPATTSEHALRQRLSWFLMIAGSAGVGMHLFSFSIGYYLPPYLIPLLLGLYLAMFNHSPDDPAARRLRHRAVLIVAAGFIVTTTLTTASSLRRSGHRGRAEAVSDATAVANALSAFPAPQNGTRRRIAVAGSWLGIYGVRLSDSQVIADIPNPDILHDPVRSAGAVHALRELGVVAMLIPRSEARPGDPLKWRAVTSAWAIADLRAASPAEAKE